MTPARRILLVEDNPADADLIGEVLSDLRVPWRLERVDRLTTAATALDHGDFDAVLLDLGLPESSGLETLRRMQALAPDQPLVLLTGADPDTLAAEAIAEGAQDYLVKGRFDGESLVRAVNYAIERKASARRVAKARALSDALNRINATIHSTFEPDTILDRVARETATAIDVEGGLVGLNVDGTFLIRHGFGVAESLTGQAPSLRDMSAMRKAQARGEVMAFNDAAHHPDVNMAVWGRVGAVAVAVAPMVVRGAVTGAVVLLSTTRVEAFGEIELDFLRKLAAAVALALDNADSYRSLIQARRAIEVGAMRFQRAFDHIPDAVVLFDRERRTAYLNERARDVAGDPAAPDAAARFWMGAATKLWQAEVGEAMQKGELKEFETEAQLPTGRRYLHLLLVPLHNSAGRADELLLLAQDRTEQRHAEAALRESEQRFRDLAENIPQLAWMADADGSIFWFNRRWYEFTGISPADVKGAGWIAVLHPEEAAQVIASFRHALKSGEPWDMVFQMRGAGGNYCWFLTRAFPIRDAQGSVTRWFGTNTDITAQRRVEEELRRTNSVLDAIGTGTPTLITVRDRSGRFVSANPASLRFWGKSEEEVIGRPLAEVLDPITEAGTRKSDQEVMERGEVKVFEQSVEREDGVHWILVHKSPWRGPDGGICGVVVIATDITERKRMEEQIRHIAHHDALTGLPNRLLFREIADVQLAQAKRQRTSLALLFVDLDRFKHVNDTLGHEVGDQLLQAVSQRLRGLVRRTDTLARIGGDEFNVLVTDLARPELAREVARSLVTAFERPFEAAGHQLFVSCSVGVSLYPEDGANLDVLSRHADVAMYHAKEQGRNRFEFFNEQINRRSLERLRTEFLLRQSIERKELEVVYQPLVELRSERMVGAEALVRWRNPERGLLWPDAFLSIAEEIGFMDEIDTWVMAVVGAQIGEWNRARVPVVPVNINLSARQFQSLDLEQRFDQLFNDYGLLPGQINVEITETVAMSDIDRAVRRMQALANIGVQIAIDDFGTGYSSLSWLKRMPVARLKIDRSFVQDISVDPNDRAVVAAVVSMAHSMQLIVVAEGVESPEQLALVRDADCDEGQGYLFTAPLPPAEFGDLLRRGELRAPPA